MLRVGQQLNAVVRLHLLPPMMPTMRCFVSFCLQSIHHIYCSVKAYPPNWICVFICHMNYKQELRCARVNETQKFVRIDETGTRVLDWSAGLTRGWRLYQVPSHQLKSHACFAARQNVRSSDLPAGMSAVILWLHINATQQQFVSRNKKLLHNQNHHFSITHHQREL